MKLIIPIILLFFSYLASFSQTKNFIIADHTDRTALPYATIKAVNASTGYYSDKNGMVTIPLYEKDSLMIEYAGHTSTIFVAGNNIDTIFLDRKEYELLTVEIKTANNRYETGCLKYSKSSTIFFSASTEYALKIDMSSVKGNYYRVQQLFMPLDINKKTFKECIVKIHSYKEAPDGTPGEDLLAKPVFLNEDSLLKKDFYTDVSDQQLILSEKYLFIGIECIMNKITALYNPNLSERKSFNQQANLSPISLYISKGKQLFDGGYGHKFIRFLNSPSYKWFGNTLSKETMNFAAGLVVLGTE